MEGSGSARLPAAALAAWTLPPNEPACLTGTHSLSYWLHILTFFFFLNFLPLGKHFHIITALPNVFLRKLGKGSIKPAQWGVDDLDDLESLGHSELNGQR